jgi:hypothetical protein
MFPRTSEYFAERPKERDGLNPACRECVLESDRKRIKARSEEKGKARKERERSKEELRISLLATDHLSRQCNLCDVEFPVTSDFYQPEKGSKDGFKLGCRKCLSRRQMKLRKTFAERQAEAQAKRDAGLRKCRVCRKWKPADLDHFSVRNINSTGLNSMCKECQAESNSRSYQRVKSDPDLLAEYRAKSGERTKRWYRRNPDKTKAIARSYRKRHPAKMRNYASRRRATKAQLPSDFTPKDWQNALNYFGGCCAACGRPPGLMHTIAMDHFIPMTDPNCPGHVVSNIIPLCHGLGGCNNSKSNKDPETWILSHFGKRKGRKILKRIADYFATVRSTKG